ncbi:MAG: cation-translocating P-type ATPase [Bacillota bacterium]|nr:cation-translocating P-type ATPase [Bacillota bacterium]
MGDKKPNGITTEQAAKLQQQYGKNELNLEKKQTFFQKILHTLTQPMFLLLLIASIIYFLLGEPRDGAIMLIFVAVIIAIEIIQEWKTDKTLNALKDLSAPTVTVIRDGEEKRIMSADLVPGDVMIISEGVKIPADGTIIKCSDLRVDESSLTGETLGVWKTTERKEDEAAEYWRRDYCYAGTLVTQGSGLILVDKIGRETEYGKIGVNVAEAPERPTPLEKQVNRLVQRCSIIAIVFFLLAIFLTFLDIADHEMKDRIIQSILSGITLAMAMIPEEFPVVLAVFLSMGAWRLAKKNSLIRKLPAVETLGAVSVLCVDKTGTITMNQMVVQDTWAIDGDEMNLYEIMGLACETETYDPMEQAMLNVCKENGITREHLFTSSFVSEYAFTNELKMMGHVWVHEGEIVVAAKGSPESILSLSRLNKDEHEIINKKIKEMSDKGLRVIAVSMMKPKSEEEIPSDIMECSLDFCGLIGLLDPPRKTVKDDIAQCVRAGIRVVMITGDNGMTASAIARQVGIRSDLVCTGDELCSMSDEELQSKVKDTCIFSRVLPEHKMRIVQALKENGEIVAMTGDGVNDAPALKYADIGIAMGGRGSEVSREAADLILLDDNFSTIVDTIKDGRRIYENIKKAVGYIFTIHIPIAFAALCAPLLKMSPSCLLLLPVHIVLMELMIDPTCSIVFERQPSERNIMNKAPRDPKEGILSRYILMKSVIQGIAIFLASFLTYFFVMNGSEQNAPLARTMGLSIIILANLFLVQVNSSDTDSILKSVKILLKDRVILLINFVTILALAIGIYTPFKVILQFTSLSFFQIVLVVAIAFVSVGWYEIIKFITRRRIKNIN